MCKVEVNAVVFIERAEGGRLMRSLLVGGAQFVDEDDVAVLARLALQRQRYEIEAAARESPSPDLRPRWLAKESAP
jgi:hypothetical protein